MAELKVTGALRLSCAFGSPGDLVKTQALLQQIDHKFTFFLTFSLCEHELLMQLMSV